MTALWICECCRGPAKWTFIEGVVFYHCENLCDGFLQADLFPGEWVDEVRESDDMYYEGGALDQSNDPPGKEGLPF